MAGKRGLASADEETRKRVASAGGMASHGGGRKKKSDEDQDEERGGAVGEAEEKADEMEEIDEFIWEDDKATRKAA